MGVHVADLRRRHRGVREREPHGSRCLAAVGARRGHVICVVGEAVAHDLAVDLRATRQGAGPFFQYQDGRPLPHHEAVAARVERSRGVLGVVVARAHGADHAERRVGHRGERRLGATREHHVGAGLADRVERVAHRDRPRGTAHRVGRVGAGEAELDRDVAARRAREHGERERGIEPARPRLQEAADLRLREGHPAQRRAHHRTDAVAVLAGGSELGVREREPRTGDGELREAVEPLGALRLEVVLGPEVGDLRRDAAPEGRGIEARHRAHGGAPCHEARPQPVRGGPDGRHGSHPRDDDAPTIPHSHPPPRMRSAECGVRNRTPALLLRIPHSAFRTRSSGIMYAPRIV